MPTGLPQTPVPSVTPQSLEKVSVPVPAEPQTESGTVLAQTWEPPAFSPFDGQTRVAMISQDVESQSGDATGASPQVETQSTGVSAQPQTPSRSSYSRRLVSAVTVSVVLLSATGILSIAGLYIYVHARRRK